MYSPKNIIMDQDLAYEKHCKFIFGSYVEDNEYCKITNNMKEQIVSGICLGPTANFQGRYKIFFLNTGCVVTRKQKIKEILMPTWVIQRVESLTMRDRQDLDGRNESLLVDRSANENYFSAVLHEGGITGLDQDNNE